MPAMAQGLTDGTGVLMERPPVKSMSACGADVLGIGAALVVGGGYTGSRFAAALIRRGIAATVTHRRPPRSAVILPWLGFDPGAGLLPDAERLEGVTHVLITTPPDEDGMDPALGHLLPMLRRLSLRWVGYLSTTGVYGDRGGAWVDEGTPEAPSLPRSRSRLENERAWRSTGLPVQVYRLPAIYGPGRVPFGQLRNGTARMIHKPGQVFCRVHVDDIVGAVLHSLARSAGFRPETVILADDYPCPSTETLGYAAHLIGCKLPEVQPYERMAPSMSPMARSFWSENRRVSNRLLRVGLGYELRYPTFREGYRACLAEEGSP